MKKLKIFILFKIKYLPPSWYKEKLAIIALVLAAAVSTNQVSNVIEILAGSKTIAVMLSMVMEASLFLTMSALAYRYTQSFDKKEENAVNKDVDKRLNKAKSWFGFVNLWGNVFASFYYQITKNNLDFEKLLSWSEYSEISQALGVILTIISTFIIWGGVTYTIVQTSTILGVFSLQTNIFNKSLAKNKQYKKDSIVYEKDIDNIKTSVLNKSIKIVSKPIVSEPLHSKIGDLASTQPMTDLPTETTPLKAGETFLP